MAGLLAAVLAAASPVAAQGVDCSGEQTIVFRGSGWDSPRVRYVGPAASGRELWPHSGSASGCVPVLAEGESLELVFTADAARLVGVGVTGDLGVSSPALRWGRWLVGAVSEQRDGDNNITRQATVLTVTAPQGAAGGFSSRAWNVRLAPTGSSLRQTTVPIAVVPFEPPPDTRPAVSIEVLFNLNDRTEGQSANFRIVRPSGFTGPVNVRLTESGDFLTGNSKGVLGTSVRNATDLGLSTVDDGVWEPDGAVTAEVLPGEGYRVAPGGGSATVRVRDNDEAIAVSQTAATLAEGESVSYTVRLNGDPGGSVAVYARVSQPPASRNAEEALGVCLHRCRGQRRSASGYNHQAAWTTFDSSNWDRPQTFEVYRYPDDGYPRFGAPASWTVTHHLGGGHHNRGPSLQITLPAPPPEPEPEPDPEPAGPEFGTGDRDYVPLTDYPNGPTPHRCTARGGVAHTAKRYHDANKHRAAYADNPRWARVLAAFGWTLPDAPYNTVEPLTVAEAQAQEAHWTGWTPIRIELQRLETCRSAPCQAALRLPKGRTRDIRIGQHCPGVLD